MAPHRRPTESTGSSINYTRAPLDLNPINVPSTTARAGRRPPDEARDAESAGRTILSTADLLSVLGGAWRAIGHRNKAGEAEAIAPRAHPNPAGCLWRGSELEFEEVCATKWSLLFDLGAGCKAGKITLGSCSDLGLAFWRIRREYFCSLGGLLNRSGSERKRLDCVESEEDVCLSSVPVGLLNLEETSTPERSFNRYKDNHIDFLVSYDNAVWESRAMRLPGCVEQSGAEDVPSNVRSIDDTVYEEGCDPGEASSIRDGINAAFSRKKYALAGAMAGSFVSLCLHPVDTVKTVVQAHSVNGMPISRTLRSIVSERGIMGLYRGIASSMASSAPISAVYTCTYETVKGALSPVLQKEYHSFAHCTAGGCASIATSFIFTPSERIKQQMQVRSSYRNCWNALLGVLEKGGLQSLYAGWGAVLCRNVPHSIIKFYTYESLKQFLLQPSGSNAPPLSTFQTLLCGGVAGSTAALFSTPFDVVKTKFQTQVPGSSEYKGVFQLLKLIARNEGLGGLYRGLIPRLVMYVSQGALFFASYEFFKAIFSLEVLPGKEEESID